MCGKYCCTGSGPVRINVINLLRCNMYLLYYVCTGGRGSMSSLGGGENGQLYRPGLSAGISGAGYAEDGRSVASSIQSSVAAVSQANQPKAEFAR